MKIAERSIDRGHPVYIVAEMSANHGHDFDTAVRIIRAAKEAGADAIKVQTYTPDTLTIDCDRTEFRIGKGTLWEGRTLYQLYGDAYLPWDWQPKLKSIANDTGLHFFSTPFDATAVDFLETMDVPAHKIASFELVDAGLLCKVAHTGKPVILSTGMATREEIDEAVAILRGAGCEQLALLKCTSAYPAAPEEMNLRTIPDMAQHYGVPIGLSDHTLGIITAVTSVALGACIIEKHFTLCRADGGPDSAFSLEPHEFKAMVDAIREAEKAMGTVTYEVSEHEKANRLFRRSLFTVRDMKAGELFTEKNVRSIRPGHGLLPKFLVDVLGKEASCSITRGTPLSWELIRNEPV
ncbi:MAG: pseudaminic acid synthase [Lentisphaerae bacterium GWF2_57_35]|nr:MAG: pseudaminic acid synthase [Lentisphaerae bacterium GWF2_57_35]